MKVPSEKLARAKARVARMILAEGERLRLDHEDLSGMFGFKDPRTVGRWASGYTPKATLPKLKEWAAQLKATPADGEAAPADDVLGTVFAQMPVDALLGTLDLLVRDLRRRLLK